MGKNTENTNAERLVSVSVLSLESSAQAGDYRFSILSGLLRDIFSQAGLGKNNPDVPLADIIHPGMTVLLKPNWVLHENLGGHGMDCMVTHPNFLLAVLTEVFKTKPQKVIIGDAPVQACDFNALVTPEWLREVEKIATCPFEVVDFRRTILHKGSFVEGQHRDLRSEQNYILFDLGKESLLEPVSSPDGRFRITCYDPDQLAERHRPGRHQYLLCREPFEADVILNLPKLKTHKKAGITAALKNLVGLNGNKEYLPHHRIGGSAGGGDCYPGFAPMKRLAEYCLDEANRRIGTKTCTIWRDRTFKLLDIHRRFGNPEIEGGWHGNDTVWRMVLDLNRILLYGRQDGTMADTPQRRIYSITDGIIAGEGDGPLAPSPVPLGIVTFSASSACADLAHAALMGFDPRKIPLVREAFGSFRYPLVQSSADSCEFICNGKSLTLDELRAIGKGFRPPSGWKGHIEAERKN